MTEKQKFLDDALKTVAMHDQIIFTCSHAGILDFHYREHIEYGKRLLHSESEALKTAKRHISLDVIDAILGLEKQQIITINNK